MKKAIFSIFFCLLCATVFAQVESPRQVQWGFIAFISRILLAIFIVGSFISGFLFARQIDFKQFLPKKKRYKKRHGTSKQTATSQSKHKKVYQAFLIITIVATIITYQIYLKAIHEFQTPEPEFVIEQPIQ